MTSSNILRGAFAALALPLLACGQAMAQKPTQSKEDILKELDISNVRKPAQKKTGRAAVEAVFDRLVRIRFGDTHNMFFFAASGSVIVTRGAPKSDVLMGTWRAQAGTDKICFDFKGEVPATCDRFEVTGDQVMLIADNGRRFAGALVPEKKPAAQTAATQKPAMTAPTRADPAMCKSMQELIHNGEIDAFEGFIDVGRAPVTLHPSLPTQFHSTMKFAGETCRISSALFSMKHSCRKIFVPEDAEAKRFYAFMVVQTQSCMGEKIIKKAMDQSDPLAGLFSEFSIRAKSKRSAALDHYIDRLQVRISLRDRVCVSGTPTWRLIALTQVALHVVS